MIKKQQPRKWNAYQLCNCSKILNAKVNKNLFVKSYLYYYFNDVCLCPCVGMCTRVGCSRRPEILDPLELESLHSCELSVPHGCWEPTLGPLHEPEAR